MCQPSPQCRSAPPTLPSSPVPLVLAILAAVTPQAEAQALSAAPLETCTVHSIHDGDTLRVDCAGTKQQLRLYCNDAPELSLKPWGTESRNHLRKITPRTVSVRPIDTDRYGRTMAEVLTPEPEGKNLNLAMVTAGEAAVYPKYCREDRYTWVEAVAKSARRGIWAKPGGHQSPWLVRHR